MIGRELIRLNAQKSRRVTVPPVENCTTASPLAFAATEYFVSALSACPGRDGAPLAPAHLSKAEAAIWHDVVRRRRFDVALWVLLETYCSVGAIIQDLQRLLRNTSIDHEKFERLASMRRLEKWPQWCGWPAGYGCSRGAAASPGPGQGSCTREPAAPAA